MFPYILGRTLLFALIAVSPIVILSPADGHSLVVNLAWLTAFDGQLFEGELYPRWLSGLWRGAGAPDFFFYGPLPFWIATSFGRALCLGCTIDGIYFGGAVLLLAVSGVGYWFFARRFFSPRTAHTAALLYMLLPYHLFMDLHIRHAIGEFAAMTLLPFVANLVLAIGERKRFAGPGLALAIAALALAHLPSTMIVGVVLFFVVVWICLKGPIHSSSPLSFIRSAAFWAVIGIALAAFYWLPAVTLLADVSPQELWRPDLSWFNWLFFDGYPEPQEFIAWGLKAWLILLVAATAAILAFGPQIPAEIRYWIIIPLSVSIFFMTPLSWPVWKVLLPLQAVQLPWRFMQTAEFGFPLAIAGLIEFRGTQLGESPTTSKRWSWFFLAGAVVVYVFGLPLAAAMGPSLVGHWGGSRKILQYAAAGYTVTEYLPPVAYEIAGMKGKLGNPWEISEWPEKLGAVQEIQTSPKDKTAKIQKLSSRTWFLSFVASSQTQVVFKQLYWKHWRARNEDTGEIIPLSPDPEFGLTQFSIPAGTTRIKLELPLHWSEKAGNAISALAALLVVLGFVLPRRQAR